MSELPATSLKRFHPLTFASRFISSILFSCLLFAGWIALSYFKNSMPVQRNLIAPATNLATSPTPVIKQSEAASTTEINSSDETSSIVYLLSSDKEHFHTLKHLPMNVERIGLCADAAIKRGLKPCPLCFAR